MHVFELLWGGSQSLFKRVEALKRRRREAEMPLPIKRAPRMAAKTLTGSHLTPTQQANLRIFRQVVVELRRALAMERGGAEGFKIVNGYIESEAERKRIRNLCIPVRRSYRASDPVHFRRILALVETSSRPEIQEAAAELDHSYGLIEHDLQSVSILNDRRVPHSEMFEAWIDAMVFYEEAEKVRRYNAMVMELGKATEGIGLHLADRIADHVQALDDLVADYLDEPRGGPPAEDASVEPKG